MPADTVNRETVRDAFATLLSSALVGTGKPVQAVYNYPYEVSQSQQTPVVCVASSGTARRAIGIGDTRKYDNYFVLEVFTFVRDADTVAGWTEAMVEDRLDLIDKEIADTVLDNRVNANWNDLGFALDPDAIPDPSEIISDTERGYKIEMRKVYIKRVDV